MLARTEAVASSRIEDEHADLDDYARAVVGSRANGSATLMVAATAAIRRMQDDATDGTVTASSILRAHHDLLRDDPVDGRDAGRWRTVQNWIGGGRSPRLAAYVPPPPELVPGAMDDLLAFVARDDVHPVAQAAIAHAQFESIHPFTDGNGRIGRALIGAVLRRRGITTAVTAPVATVLVADRARYFDHLVRYRSGAVHDFVADLAIAVGTACDEAALTALLLDPVLLDPAPLDPALLDLCRSTPSARPRAHRGPGRVPRPRGRHHDGPVRRRARPGAAHPPGHGPPPQPRVDRRRRRRGSSTRSPNASRPRCTTARCAGSCPGARPRVVG